MQDVADPLFLREDVVQGQTQLRKVTQFDPCAESAADEACGVPEVRETGLLPSFVAHYRKKHHGILQVACYPATSNRYETDGRVRQLIEDYFGDSVLDSGGNAFLPVLHSGAILATRAAL